MVTILVFINFVIILLLISEVTGLEKVDMRLARVEKMIMNKDRKVEVMDNKKLKTVNGFDLQDFKTGVIAVSCPTEEKAKDFLMHMHEKGFKWCNKDSLLESNNEWHVYKESTGYIYCPPRQGLAYMNAYVKGNGCKVIEWEVNHE